MEHYGLFMVIPADDAAALAKRKPGQCRVVACQQEADWCCEHARTAPGRSPLHEAEKVMAEIKKRWPADQHWQGDLFMTSHEHEELPDGSWAIAWEGGPEDWTMHASGLHGRAIEVDGGFVEALSHWAVAVHPA